MHLITNIKNKIEDVIKQSIEKIKFERDIILESYKIDIDNEKYKEILIKEKEIAIKENMELLNQFLKIIDKME